MRKESGMGRMWVNPYKSLVPQVGYYDINCLIEALKLKKCHVSLHAVFNPKVRPYPYLRILRAVPVGHSQPTIHDSEPMDRVGEKSVAFRVRYLVPPSPSPTRSMR